MELTHFGDQGRARMVDVTDKEKTFRTAVAEGTVRMAPATAERVRAGGVAKELEITGSEGVKTVNGQGQIRSILGNTSLTIRRKDGTTINGFDTLPSAFIAVEKSGSAFRIYGGGYGHGAGMSQNGAQGMAKGGSDYEDILKFFYSGTELETVEKEP